MSAAEPTAAWQREGVAETFLHDRDVLIPLLDVQNDVILRVLRAQQRPIARFIDVGGGDGATTELVLRELPGAHGVLLDFSEPMLARAGARLQQFDGRWQPVRGDLMDAAWVRDLPAQPYDAAVSSFAIHHLPAQRKRELFAELFELLAPGATFVNMDFVTVDGPLLGSFDAQMVANLVAAESQREGGRSPEEIERHLLGNLDGDEDQPDSSDDQVRWLAEAGFADAEVHFKWGEAAVFGGTKPQEEGDDS
ncbi:MAG TPA: methyltransferase [Solirubrobacteraceae bacterium]|jgi:ubiquinone/menaquinone biosynthesis C-methylase UbiE|nr:methyltransferase [Solirubrobacteraceae bacterium]